MIEDDMDVDHLTGSPQTSSQWVARAFMDEEPPETDVIRWQPSQSASAAFNALLKEASRPKKRRELYVCLSLVEACLEHSTATQPSNSLFADPARLTALGQASSSKEKLDSTSTRTARPRSRLLRRSPSANTLAGPSTAIPMNSDFTQLIKDAAQLVDEHAFINKRYFESQQSRTAGSSSKAVVNPQPSRGRSTVLRPDKYIPQSSRSDSGPFEQRNANSGHSRTSSASRTMRTTTVVYDQSVEMIDVESLSYSAHDAPDSSPTPSRPKASRGVSGGHQLSRDTTKSQVLMPPPRLLPQASSSRPSTTSLHTTDTSASRSTTHTTSRRASPITPPTEYAPLASTHKPPPPSLGPRASQQSRPPALGMRRAHIPSSSTFAPSQTLPTRQKGFKPPLSRPPANPLPASASQKLTSHTPALGASRTTTQATLPTPELTPTTANVNESHGAKPPQRTRYGSTSSSRSSSPAPPEADSSYGELPFDISAIEEAMRKYD
ncbi:hypothetical protein CERSUDRAFT_99520 [Gelatoporia subvermispora B]|uniref:Uncharacterized protein n=1 Tax=Ceriporiopsis subvermispora (strain B) TaxID=914234 RepID=M2Q6K9_CERS8|nr:hypothetical protein CERSUDRAFT_99520 [Gelatoporia subvermispora B]